MTHVLGGRTDIAFTTSPFIADLKPLAILSPERSEALPDLPTAVEQGFPKLVMVSSRGFAVPKGVPEPILAKLRAAFEKVATSKEHLAKAAELKLSIQVIGGEDYARYVHENHDEARKLVELSRTRGQ